jgi:hypothetical protein
MSDRIKVVGYAKKIVYDGTIEYRPFSPDLVGTQLASDGGTPFFTMGNFSVTKNFDAKKNKVFTTNNFSNFVTLTDLDLTLQKTIELLSNNAGVILNLDRKKLSNYSLFAPFTEYLRVALENIITTWPAALYVNPLYNDQNGITISGLTFENYTYDSITNKSKFKINVNVVNNNFQINYLQNGTIKNTYNETNDLRNLTVNYLSYAIKNGGNEYDILEFTGTTTNNSNEYLYLTVKGDVFSGSTNGYTTFYVKPNETQVNLFFNNLPDFENYLLNRQSNPRYTATFNFGIRTDSGVLVYTNNSVTWPTTDGYNIDFDTFEYTTYANNLITIADNFDSTTSNLIIRFLVSESVTEFDTTNVHLDPLDQDTSGQKINKTLTLYGVEYDKLNSFIQGIQFANTVSYDKSNNMPDIYLKNLARVLGWELVSSILENDLLKTYVTPKPSTYAGQSVGLTLLEADTELWRRIILNTPWLWKSKGSRKGVEFLFRFIGTPLGLISFNEYIYLAENKIDVDVFSDALRLNNLSTDITSYPISLSGYPQPLQDTSTSYFQGNGGWYRETGGDASMIDINTGNNPHIGPYDGGSAYINNFRTLIPNFSAVTVTSETTTTTTTNLFSNYKMGTFEANTSNLYVDVTNDNGADFSNSYVVTSSVVDDPKKRTLTTANGCSAGDTLKGLQVDIEKVTKSDCTADIEIRETYFESLDNWLNYYIYLPKINGGKKNYYTKFIDINCCKTINVDGKTFAVEPYYYNEVDSNGNLINSGYICCKANGNKCGCLVTCKWVLAPEIYTIVNGLKVCVFVDELNTKRITAKDGCHCPTDFTTPIEITDPLTNKTGLACRFNKDVAEPNFINTFIDRKSGTLNCDQQYYPK